MSRVLYYEGESDYDLYLYNGRYYDNDFTLSFAFDLTISFSSCCYVYYIFPSLHSHVDLRVSLVWTDPFVYTASNRILVNDLDMEVWIRGANYVFFSNG